MTEMGRLGWSDPEKAKAMTSRIPLGRFAGQSLWFWKTFSPDQVYSLNVIILDWMSKCNCFNNSTLRWSFDSSSDTRLWLWAVSPPAEVEDVVNSILFLLSDKSNMTNGVTLPVDGGFLACWPSNRSAERNNTRFLSARNSDCLTDVNIIGSLHWLGAAAGVTWWGLKSKTRTPLTKIPQSLALEWNFILHVCCSSGSG